MKNRSRFYFVASVTMLVAILLPQNATIPAPRALANSTVSFTEHTIDGDFDYAQSVYATDVDGDGDVDVLGAADFDNEIAWWENDGDENFTKRTITDSFYGASSVYATDVDGDGDVDVLGADHIEDNITWWEHDGNGNFIEHTIDNAFSANSVYATDVDGDGDVDVLGASSSDNAITWWENDGDENFTEHIIDGDFIATHSVYATDVDGDGDVDVLGAAEWLDQITWWENDGDENFTEHTIDGDFNGADCVYATDVDGDGDVDVLGAALIADDIAWWENDGDENFFEHTIDGDFNWADSVYATDVDGDGDVDVLGAAHTADDVTWWENDGNENFTKHSIAGDFDGARSVYATDVDGDGDMDILGAATDADAITWWEQGVGPSNTSPEITGLPDQTLPVNTSRNNAIDLWAYANDAESPDSDLTFTIDNTPDPNAGVSIDSNRYIDIFPTPGWTGQTDVTIRVTDPGDLFDTDIFLVAVTPAASPAITSITPNSGYNNEVVHITDLAGSNFQAGATVKLTTTGETDISADNATVVSSSQITCDFDLTGVAQGPWDVVVTNPDGQSGTLPDGFNVRPASITTEHYIYLPLITRNWPPVPDTPVLNPISNPDGDGNFSVSWNASDLAETYTMQEDDNAFFSSPETRYTGSGTSWNATDKAPGMYYYRVRASNSWADSDWSNVQSVSVQPSGKLYAVADAALLKSCPNLNTGSRWLMFVGLGPADNSGCSPNTVARSVLRFDLSVIPAASTISEARLYVKHVGSVYYPGDPDRTQPVTVYRVNESWSEPSVTWNSMPNYAEAYGSTPFTYPPAGWVFFEVTDLVRGWVNDDFPNYGLILVGPESSGSDRVIFVMQTHDTSGTSSDPYLTITYATAATSQETVQAIEEISNLP